MTFEEILEEINGFGPFQIVTVIAVYFPRVILACHFLLGNFIGVLPPYRCDISTLDNGLFQNLTEEQRLTVSVPVREDGSPKSCEMFAEPQFQLLANSSNGTDLPTIQCQSGWVYDNFSFTSSIATEWDLVCDRKVLLKTSSTIFFLGVIVGAMAFGYLSDKYGRRSTLLPSYIIAIVFGFSSTLANSYTVFVVLRFLTGIGLAGSTISSTVLSVEWISTGQRSFTVIASIFWSVGGMMLAGIAFLIRDWRRLIMTITAPIGVSLLIWWWIPESARWLLTNGQMEKAQFYLDRCAKFNKRQKLSSSLILETLSDMKMAEQRKKNYTYLDLIKTPKLRRVALLTGIVWFGVAGTCYGINFNITGFGLNIYLNQFIFAAIEVPAKLITLYFVNVIGRRRIQVATQTLAGMCIAINMFIPKGLWHVRTVVASLGKGLAEGCYAANYLYTSELYPTVLRQTGLSYTYLMASVGMTVAPLILTLEDVWSPLPQIIFSSMAFFCVLMYLLLPETLNVKLPETIANIEKPMKNVCKAIVTTSGNIENNTGTEA